jgi:hypothetical protein
MNTLKDSADAYNVFVRKLYDPLLRF